MKKVYSIAILVFLIGVTQGCGKTTKGKFEGEWKVSTYDRKYYSIQSGDTLHHYNTYFGFDYVFGTETSFGSNTEFSTTMNDATFVIKKNGEWIRTLDFSYFDNGQETRTIEETSGTWSFLKKNGNNFEKNERVLFSTTRLHATTSSQFGGVSTIYSEHSEGDIVNVFVVKKSKNNFLELQQDDIGSITSPELQEQSTYVFYSLAQ